MWTLPAAGIEPVSLALAGRFSTTGPPGKSLQFCTQLNVSFLVHTLSCQFLGFQCFMIFLNIRVCVWSFTFSCKVFIVYSWAFDLSGIYVCIVPGIKLKPVLVSSRWMPPFSEICLALYLWSAVYLRSIYLAQRQDALGQSSGDWLRPLRWFDSLAHGPPAQQAVGENLACRRCLAVGEEPSLTSQPSLPSLDALAWVSKDASILSHECRWCK